MRYLAIDYGNKKVGIALSDATGIIARPLTTIFKEHIEKITDLITENNVNAIVIGLPLDSQGSMSAQVKRVLNFIKLLKKDIPADIKIFKVNESDSTSAAKNILLQNYSKKRRRIRGMDDAIAAAVFLQSFLNGPQRI